MKLRARIEIHVIHLKNETIFLRISSVGVKIVMIRIYIFSISLNGINAVSAVTGIKVLIRKIESLEMWLYVCVDEYTVMLCR